MKNVRILIVEDEYLTGIDIKHCLVAQGYEVIGIADTGIASIRMAEELTPDLILMDIILKGEMTGIEAALQIHHDYRIPVIFLTAHSDDATVEKAVISEPFGFLIKPFDEWILNATIKMALYKHTIDDKILKIESTTGTLLNSTTDAQKLEDYNKGVITLNEKKKLTSEEHITDFDEMPISELLSYCSLSTSLQQIDDLFISMKPAIIRKKSDER